MTEQKAHRLARRIDRRLPGRRGIKPGAVQSGEVALGVGDLGEQRGPCLRRSVRSIVAPVIAARVEAKRAGGVDPGDAAPRDIALRQRARDRPAHGPETPRRLR